MNKNIVVVGCGFVGLSNAFILSKNNNIIAIDKDKEKITKLRNKEIFFKDELMEEYIKTKKIKFNFFN